MKCQESVARTQGSVKVPRVEYLESYGYITHEGTPHPPPCGPPSPRGRGGTARRWVRGRFVDTISIALEACYTRDFDGALEGRDTRHKGGRLWPIGATGGEIL